MNYESYKVRLARSLVLKHEAAFLAEPTATNRRRMVRANAGLRRAERAEQAVKQGAPSSYIPTRWGAFQD